jgi:hypothetical protein
MIRREDMVERLTVFGQVLREMMRRRGIEDMYELVERANELGEPVCGYTVGERMKDEGVDAGNLRGLANTLGLVEAERKCLALAYALEEETSGERC